MGSRLPAAVRGLQARIASGLRRPIPALASRSKGSLGVRAYLPALGGPAGPVSTAVTTGAPAAADDGMGPLPLKPLGKDEPGRGIGWVSVRSSWILALRFVPTGRQGNRMYLDGYVDMMVRYQRRCYRYGPVPMGQRNFNVWRVAASRGKYWWRYWTRRWSPARRIA